MLDFSKVRLPRRHAKGHEKLNYCSLLTALLGSLAACNGEVEIAKSPDDGTGDDGGYDAGDVAVNVPPDTGVSPANDASSGSDGWSGGFADEASAPPPPCGAKALACGEPFPGATAFASAQDAANALVGQWSFCDATNAGFYPAGQVGEEYAADGTYYELIADSAGGIQRNMDPSAIGTWQVELAANNGIEVHTYGGGVQRPGGLSACPLSLVLIGVEARIQ